LISPFPYLENIHMNKHLRTLALLAVSGLLLLAISGCNTMEGLGKDLEEAGEAIQGSASD
jgi:predicted small secreted protein